MNPTAYQTAAGRTLPANLTDRERLSMLALGVVGEWAEYRQSYDTPTEPEEAGDVLWYLAGLCTTLGVDMALLPGLAVSYPSSIDSLGDVCEPIKKHLYHGKELDKARVLRGCAHLYAHISRAHVISTVMAANIDKLRKRWPDGFGVGG